MYEMPRRKLIEISPAEEEYITVSSGGPKKVYNRRRIRNLLARRAKYAYEPVQADWFQEIVGELKLARLRLGMSQITLANSLRTSQSEVSDFETGKTNPTVEFLERVARTLGVKIKILVE